MKIYTETRNLLRRQNASLRSLPRLYGFMSSTWGSFLTTMMGLAVPVLALSQEPATVSATDGAFEDRVEITWSEVPNNAAARITIEREGVAIAVLAGSETMFSDTAGDPGVVYEYCIIVSRPGGVTEDPVCDGGSRIIFAPTDFSASDALYEDGVQLTWADRSDREAEYRISRRRVQDDFKVIETLPANAISFKDTIAVVGVEYEYCVVAVDLGGFRSATVCDRGIRASVTPPANVSASDGQYPNFVRLTWLDQSEEESGFTIYRDDISIASVTTNISHFDDATAALGVNYSYCVASMVNGMESVKICDDGMRGGLAPPINVAASDASFDDRVAIAWDDAADTEDGFEVVRTPVGETDSLLVATVPANSTIYNDFEALQGVAYTYCVRAFSNADTNATSYSMPAYDEGTRSSVLAPEDVAATDSLFEERVDISWSSRSTTAMLFNVYRNGVLVKTLPTSLTGYEDSDIASGVEYEYAVSSETVVGASPEQRQQIQSRVAAILLEAQQEGIREQILAKQKKKVPGVQEQHRRAATLLETIRREVSAFQSSAALSANGVGGLVESEKMSDVGSRKINAPTSVVASYDEFEDHVEITWEDVSEVEQGFYIYRSGVKIDSVSAGRTSYGDYESQPNVEQTYSVSTFDEFGESDQISDIGFRKLEPPTLVDASDGESETQTAITWVDNSRAESGYEIARNGVVIDTTLANTTAYIDSRGIDFGMAYEYRVVAVDPYGRSEAESDSGFTTVLPPANVNASDAYQDRVVITWIDQSVVEEAYGIERDGMALVTLPADAATFTDLTAVRGQVYSYCVEAISGTIQSNASCDLGGVPFLPSPPGVDVIDAKDLIAPDDPRKFGEGVGIGFFDTRFGSSVSISGDYIIVGRPRDNTATNGGGSAYIFRRNGDGWEQQTKLTAPSPQGFARFGAAVSISGDFAIVGAPGERQNNTAVGAVYFFKRSGNTWVKEARRIGRQDKIIGESVSISGDYAIVEQGKVSRGLERIAGAALIFERRGEVWERGPELTPSGGNPDASFGLSVSIDGDCALVGAPQLADPFATAGVVYEFCRDNKAGSWNEVARFSASDGAGGDKFGSAVALDGYRALIAAQRLSETDNDANDAIYFFRREGSIWIEEQKVASDIKPTDEFGSSIAIFDNYAVVGAPEKDDRATNSGAVFVYRRIDERWLRTVMLLPLKASIDDTLGSSGGLGTAVAMHKNDIVTGAPFILDHEGAVHAQPLVANPEGVTASDGFFDNRIQILWEDNSVHESGFKVYRRIDGELQLVGSTAANVEVFDDFSAPAGSSFEYCVTAFSAQLNDLSNQLGESDPICDIGWRPANGSLSGRVAAQAGGGTGNVEVCLDPSPNRGLLFDGTGGSVEVPSLTSLPDAFTIEFWARRAAPGGIDPIFSIGQAEDNRNVRLSFIGDDFHFGFGGEELDFTHGPGTDWNHWAVTHAPGEQHRIYRNGEEVEVQGTPADSITVDGPLFLGTFFNLDEQYFGGQLDEVRIWDHVRLPQDIMAEKELPLTGSESGLVGYWPLDQGERQVVADFSRSANHGVLKNGVYWADQGSPLDICASTDTEGNYTLTNLRYGEGTTFTVTPSLGARSFDPAFKTITLNAENPVQNEVDFIDNTAFTISGIVQFDSTQCPVPDVEIYVDGIIKGTTESDGTFAVAVDPSEDGKDLRRIEARLVNPRDASDVHDFIPADTLLDGHFIDLFVDNDIRDVNFLDTKTRTLSGFFGGSCGIYIGSATLRIFTENGCFEREIQVDRDYKQELPPQPYLVQVSNVDPTNDALRADIIAFFDKLGAQQIDLTAADDTLDFIYHAPLKVAIEGLPDPQCDVLTIDDDRKLPSVPVIEQGVVVPLTITIFEDFGNEISCPVDEGIVTIFDEIGDRANTPIELSVSDGNVAYDITAGAPNIFAGRSVEGVDRSFQKSFTVLAQVEGRDPLTVTEWALVTGDRPRAATFVTVTSDEHPLLVIQDPPGDGSYAFLGEDTKFCKDFEFEEAILVGFESEFKVKLGSEMEVGTPFNSVPFEANGTLELSAAATAGPFSKQALHFCLTTTERFGTSSDHNFIGADADIFVGAALNFEFAEADRLEVAGCSVKLSEILAGGLSKEPFATTFIYTTQHIRDVLIPQLESLIIQQDSTNTATAGQFERGIEKWKNFIAQTDSSREEIGDLEPTEENNRSFSAGTNFEYTETRDTTKVFALGLKETLSFTIGSETKFNIAGAGAELKFVFKTSAEFVQQGGTTTTDSRSVGYVLADDDLGDFFTVTVGDFERYGTKSFALKSGTSSNPWEIGTQPRDRALLAINPPVQTGIPPDKAATFTLSLTNAGESQEVREYILRTVHTSNPGGAILSANGSPLHAGLSFYIGAQQTQEVTLKVNRGPTRYAYEDLAVQLYPPGEYPIWQDGGLNGNGIIQQADTARFSVSFNAPCSDISILRPLENWSVNSATIGDSLEVILQEFVLTPSESDKVAQLGLEYRLQGTSTWLPAVNVRQTDLAEDATSWSAKWRPPQDGVYEVRAFTECDVGGRVYSEPIVGTVDTKPPQVLGTPEPSDQVLALGSDIAITFDEEIDCSSVVTQGNGTNVTLTYVDGANAGTSIAGLEAVCDGRTITLSPPKDFDWSQAENLRLEARLVTSVRDLAGNAISDEISWQFTVRRSALLWRPTNLTADVFLGNRAAISATLVNGRAQEASFSLMNLPEWLTPSVAQGSLPPGGEIQITFTVADTLRLGRYEATVAAHTDEGDALLYITANVAEDDRPRQSIPLAAGWHWFSINRDPSNPAINQILGDLVSTNGDIVKSQTAFSVFDRTAGGWVGSLNSIEPGQTYLIKSASANTVVVDGSPVEVANTPLTLASGWNWIGYLPQRSLPVNDALASLTETAVDSDLVKSQIAFAVYQRDMGWVGSLQEMNPGLGYRLFTANGGELTYPNSSNASSRTLASIAEAIWEASVSRVSVWAASLQGPVTHPDKTFVDNAWGAHEFDGNTGVILDKMVAEDAGWTLDPKAYAFSMTINAQLQIDGALLEASSTKLGAFVGDELRGVARLRYVEPLESYLAFLMVYSHEKDGEEIQFRIFDSADATIHACAKVIGFEADARLGTPKKPLVFNSPSVVETENHAALPREFALAQNYPNPFNPTTTIHYELPKASHVRIKVFNILGREVDTLLDDDKEAGRYDLVVEAGHWASGIYFYQIEAGDFGRVRKMVLLK